MSWPETFGMILVCGDDWNLVILMWLLMF